MNPKKLFEAYVKKKDIFHDYINNIKRKSQWDIYNIINPTLIKNPYASDFPKYFFMGEIIESSKFFLFIKALFKYYIKNFYLFVSYIIAYLMYIIYYKKQRQHKVSVLFDIFALVEKTNQNNKFEENYLANIYKVLDKHHIQYTMLIRPYGALKNPFKLKQFFQILSQEDQDYIFEYEFLSFLDFIKLLWMITLYPFKTLRLLRIEIEKVDEIFNFSLINDIKYFSFDSLTRFILGKNISKIKSIEKIYSWSEFQVIERSFNYGIRENNTHIKLIALQYYLNYEIYFNSYVDDLDAEMLSAPNKVIVNGKYYVLSRKKVKYELGVSLRYKNIFTFDAIKEEKYILLLGSYIESETKNMLESLKGFECVIFKNHPAVDIKKFYQLLSNIEVSDKNIYKLFEHTKIVISTASGTAVEAVACGVSVIVIASQDNLTANPLVAYGKGKIWDIAFSKNDVKRLYNKLLDYRKNNIQEMKNISRWYKENFFIEPTEENIMKTFEL